MLITFFKCDSLLDNSPFVKLLLSSLNSRAAVGMGILMKIPIHMDMGCLIPMVSVGILWEFLNRCEIRPKTHNSLPRADSRWPVGRHHCSMVTQSELAYVQPAAVAGHSTRYFFEFNDVGTATGDKCQCSCNFSG